MSSPAQNHYFAYQAAQPPREDHPVIQRKRNFLMAPLQKLQNWQESLVQFVFSIIYMIARLPFNIGLRILDLIQRGIRYLVWINIKSAVSWLNFMYRCLAFFRVTPVINFIDSIAKEHFRAYSSIDFDKAEQPSRFSLIMRKKNYDLINIDKFEKRIKTPTFFIKRDVPKVQERQDVDQLHENQNRPIFQQPLTLVRQRSSEQSREDRNVNPQLVNLSRSHERMKKPEMSLNSPIRNPRMTVEIPNRTQNQGSQTRIFPDRDISPQRYMKRIPRIGQDTFSEEQHNINLKPSLQGFQPSPQQLECQIDKYPKLEEEISQKTKEQLEQQLSYLKSKMQQLIDDNNNYIQELEQWLKEKSQTMTQTRKENIELFEEMQRLQKQNVKKTKSLKQIEDRISEIQNEVHQQQAKRASVSSRIMTLNDEIRNKSLELMKLKEKINRNYKMMEESEKRQRVADTKLNKSEDESTLQNSMAQEDFDEEQEIMQKLKQEEEKTYELAEKVQRLVEEETKRVDDTKIELEPIKQSQSEKKGSVENKRRKKSEPVVLSSNGKSRITMTRE